MKATKKYYQTLFLFLTLFLLTAYSLPLNATIRFVSKTGNSTPPYTTWETAADSIQKCINICVFGDTIYVANGVYKEQVVMIPGLSLIGAGMDSCVIDTRDLVTSQNFTTVKVSGDCLFRGFIIRVNNDTDEGIGIGGVGNITNSLIIENSISTCYEGIYLGGNPTIDNNYFDNVSVGIESFNSNAIVKNNIINTANYSQLPIIAGIYFGAFNNNYKPIIDSNYIESIRYGIYKGFGSRSIIKNNTIRFAQDGEWAIFLSTSDSTYIYNNLILNDAGYSGIGNYGVQYLQVVNNYITGNPSSIGMEITSYNFVKNNIVINNNIGIDKSGSLSLVFQFNNVWNNGINYSGFTPDSTNLSVDPMIVNDDTTQGELDFHLQAYSPLIDAGDPTILDRDGSRSDIGLYGGPYGWSYTYEDLAPRPPRNLNVIVDTMIILSWNKNSEADFNHYNLYRDTTANFNIDTTKLVVSLADTFYLHTIPQGVERLYFKLIGVDNQGNESNPSEEVAVILLSVENEWKPVEHFILYPNYPNPFNPSTVIPYRLKEGGYVKLYVYDVKGELVRILVNDWQERGYYEVMFNPTAQERQRANSFEVPMGKRYTDIATGVYLYMIQVYNGNRIPVFFDSGKMILLK